MYYFLRRIILSLLLVSAVFISPQSEAYECRIDDVENKSADELIQWMTFKDKSDAYGPKCGNKNKKLYKALDKRDFEKLPDRPPLGLLQYAGLNLGHCFGARNSEVILPPENYVTTNVSKRQCEALAAAAYEDNNKSSDEMIWRANYIQHEKKRGKACAYLPTSLIEKNRNIYDKIREIELNPGKYDQVAKAKRAGFCHPGISDNLDERAIRDYTYSTFSSSKIVDRLDPGDGRITNDTVRISFSLYAMKKASISRFMNAYDPGKASKISTVLSRCFSPKSDGIPKIDCGFKNNVAAYNSLSRDVYAKRLTPGAEKGFGGEYSEKTLAFMEENLGSCIRKAGVMTPSGYLEQRDFAKTQEPRPYNECEDVAGMIQYFIEQPGSVMSSSGYSYNRKASYSEQAWLQKWNMKKAARQAQCINDYPKRIMKHIQRLDRENERRELSEARARTRYQNQLAIQGRAPTTTHSGNSYISTAPNASPTNTISSSEAAENARRNTCAYGYQGTDACK